VWSDRDKASVWHPFTQMHTCQDPVVIERGEKEFLFSTDRRCFIDGISSWWVTLHGHAHPYITQKVQEQLRTLEHVIFAGFTHPGAIKLSERILDIVPGGFSKAFFSDNGSTAVEVALKIAIQYYFHRQSSSSLEDSPILKIIAFRHAYHGDTFGSMSVSERSVFNRPFWSYLFPVEFIDPPIPGQEETSLRQLDQCLKNHGGGPSVFIFEPLIQGAGGMIMHKPDALDKLINCAKNYQTLTIADEVMTGFGRTGKFFALSHLKSTPDFICLAKGLTGGTIPLAMTLTKDFIYEAFLSKDKTKAFFHGHSFTANPTACAAALASLDLLTEKDCQQRIDRLSAKQRTFSQRLSGNMSVKNIRQCGTICAFDWSFKNTETSYFHPSRDSLYDYFLSHGILLRPLGNVCYIMPPYCISDKSLDKIYQAILGFIEKV